MSKTHLPPHTEPLRPVRWLDRHNADLIALAQQLIGIDTQNPPGNTETIIEFIIEYIQGLGLETKRVVADQSKPNLLITVPGESDTTLLYNGHVDTVPYDSDDWTFDPLGERVGDRLYGRGATDMKGAVASMLQALQAYAETETKPPVTLKFAFVSDEETAGPAGLPVLLKRDHLSADACVIGETTCEAGMHSVTVADKGSIWLTLEADGKAAHGSRPPLGENAIDRLFDAIADIREWLSQFEFDLDPEIVDIIEESVAFYAPRLGEETAWKLFTKPTMNIGTFEGGGTINQVPETAMAELDIRLTAGVETSSVLACIRDILWQHPTVRISDVSWSNGTYESFDSPLVEATSQVAEAVSGERIYRRSATGGGDIKNLRNEGISTIEFAFGSGSAHSVDEYVPIHALIDNARVFTMLPYSLASRLTE